MAVNALRNSQIVRTETKGLTSDVQVSYPVELLAAFRSLFGAGRGYDFQLHLSGTQASTGGGVVQGYHATTLSAFAEGSALAALFDECRSLRSMLTWTTAFGQTSSAIAVQIALAFDMISTGATTTFTPILRLAGSTEFAIGVPGRGGSYTGHHSRSITRGRLYGMTASPYSSTADVGMNGAWVWASNIVTTVSINYAFTTLRAIVRFRCRA